MNVVALGPDDRDAALALWHQAGLTRPWNDPVADYDRALAGPASAVLGRRDACGALVATAMVGHDGHRGWLYYLAVAPGARRAGHGRAMVAAAEGWVAERGIPKMQLMLRHGNHAALGFYDALGYAPSDVTVLSRQLI